MGCDTVLSGFGGIYCRHLQSSILSVQVFRDAVLTAVRYIIAMSNFGSLTYWGAGGGGGGGAVGNRVRSIAALTSVVINKARRLTSSSQRIVLWTLRTEP